MKQTYWEKIASEQTTEQLRSDISGWLAKPKWSRVAVPKLSLQKAWKKELEAREAMQEEKEKEKERNEP